MKRSIYDTSINPDRLDIEQVANIEMIKYWNKKVATCTKERDWIKHKIKSFEATYKLKINKNPLTYEFDHYTDKLAEAAIYAKSEYQTLQEELIEANFQLTKAYGYKDAFAARGIVLGNLQRLYMNNYYTEGVGSRTQETSASDMLEDALKNRKKRKEANE